MATGSVRQPVSLRFAIHLDEHQCAILEQWRRQIQSDGRVESSERLSPEALFDHLPDILDDISHLMRQRETDVNSLQNLKADSETHGTERWMQGYSLVELIREIEHFRKILLIDVMRDFALQNTDVSPDILAGLGSALFDYSQQLIVKSVEELTEHRDAELRAANDKVIAANLQLDMANKQLLDDCHQFREISLKDPLTNLANRRQLDTQLKMEVDRCIRYGASLCVVMMDIDHFKRINDTYGHVVGDRVLVQIARLLEHHSRVSDHIARYGGEEFLLILPQSDLGTAAILADRIRTTLPEVHIHPMHEQITGSFGVAQWQSGETPEQLLSRTDSVLYDAKAAGRDRVVVSPSMTKCLSEVEVL